MVRQFEDAALIGPKPLAPAQINERICEQPTISQAVFARRLNTCASTGEKWETGAMRPGDVA